jgi:hypothetical protein
VITQGLMVEYNRAEFAIRAAYTQVPKQPSNDVLDPRVPVHEVDPRVVGVDVAVEEVAQRELAGDHGDAFDVAGGGDLVGAVFVNGEAQKAGAPFPKLRSNRYFVRQTFGLGGETRSPG